MERDGCFRWGGPPETQLLRSRLVQPEIDSLERAARPFPASPRCLETLTGENWLACGSAAMAWDPICGDGTANAVRQAILASAVVMAALRVEDPAAVRDHYQRRLLLGFERHLVLCRDFYQSGRRGPWWDGELALLAEGIAWSAKRVNGRPFRFQLNGFELESRC